jgi:hypothetical protein
MAFYRMQRSDSFSERRVFVASDGWAYARPNVEAGSVVRWAHDGGYRTDSDTKQRVAATDLDEGVWAELLKAWSRDRSQYPELQTD